MNSWVGATCFGRRGAAPWLTDFESVGLQEELPQLVGVIPVPEYFLGILVHWVYIWDCAWKRAMVMLSRVTHKN